MAVTPQEITVAVLVEVHVKVKVREGMFAEPSGVGASFVDEGDVSDALARVIPAGWKHSIKDMAVHSKPREVEE